MGATLAMQGASLTKPAPELLPAPISELNKDSSPKMETIRSKRLPQPKPARTIGSPPKSNATPSDPLLAVGSSIWSEGKGWGQAKQTWSNGPSTTRVCDTPSPLLPGSNTSSQEIMVTPLGSPAKSPLPKHREPPQQPIPVVQLLPPLKAAEPSNSWEAATGPPTKGKKRMSKGFVKVQDPTWSKPSAGWSDAWG